MLPIYNKSYFEGPHGYVETLHVSNIQEGQHIDVKGVRVTKSFYARATDSDIECYHLDVREIIKVGEFGRISLPPGSYLFEKQVKATVS